ncbi:hypothetical protein ACF1AB_05410 [Streptomyces sp. NPDC014846]|uniref:hypothetical protein n=1 Tax=unclassified Streptomyces TaxID=2593676 RepID=UPI0036F96753
MTGNDEYDGIPACTVDVRIGGVLAVVTVENGLADDVRLDDSVSLAASTARQVRSVLYGVDGQ